MAENRSKWRAKWLMMIVAAAAIIAGGFGYFGRGSDEAPEYQTATVARGDLTQVVTATGALNPVLNVQVGCQVSGRIRKLYADFNSQVQQGQLIAEIDPSTYQATVEQATADLANARANLELQQVQSQRSANLFTNNLISGSEYDISIATLHQAEAAVRIKQASLSNAMANLGYCKIYSPVDGTVISRNVDIGQTVAASLSAPTLFQIANDLTKMQIDANVSEADIGSVEEGQNVSFTVDAFPDRKFTGTVKQIRNSPTTVQNVVTYDVVIEVSNPDLKLRPGMTANASIITAERIGVLRVPNAALRFRPPEPSTNKTLLARWFGGEKKNPATNAPAAKVQGTNKVETAAAEAPLTGNEPPEELMRRVREMRERGEEVPQAIRSKLRELFQSGALQRPGGGGFGQGGGFGGGGGGRSRGSSSASRTVYLLAADASAEPAPQPVRVKVGISDGIYTEIADGIKEGDAVITSIKSAQPATASASSTGTSPFGPTGGGGRRGGFR